MAEVAEDSPDGTKINCRSRRACADIVDNIHHRVCQIVNDYDDLEKNSKDECKQRFKEVFETAMQRNIAINGCSWEDASTDHEETSEYEPMDMEMKKYITVDMMETLDDALVKTSQNRRTCKQRYRCKLKQQAACESEYLGRIRVQFKDDQVEGSGAENYRINEKVYERLKETESTLSHLSKSTNKQGQRLKNLQKSLAMHRDSKNSKTDYVVYNPAPDEAVMAESITPLKNNQARKTPAKGRCLEAVMAKSIITPLKKLTNEARITSVKRCSPRLQAKKSNHRT